MGRETQTKMDSTAQRQTETKADDRDREDEDKHQNKMRGSFNQTVRVVISLSIPRSKRPLTTSRDT